MTRNRATLAFLLGLTIVALYFCYLLIAPFLSQLSSQLSSLFSFIQCMHAFNRWIRNRNIAAAISTSLVILLITSLFFFLGQALVSGLREFTNR